MKKKLIYPALLSVVKVGIFHPVKLSFLQPILIFNVWNCRDTVIVFLFLLLNKLLSAPAMRQPAALTCWRCLKRTTQNDLFWQRCDTNSAKVFRTSETHCEKQTGFTAVALKTCCSGLDCLRNGSLASKFWMFFQVTSYISQLFSDCEIHMFVTHRWPQTESPRI